MAEARKPSEAWQSARSSLAGNKDLEKVSHWRSGVEHEANLILHYTKKYCQDGGFTKADGSSYDETPKTAQEHGLLYQMVEVRWKDPKNKGQFKWEEAEVLVYDAGHKEKGKDAPYKVRYTDDGDEVWHNMDKKIFRLKEPYDEALGSISRRFLLELCNAHAA